MSLFFAALRISKMGIKEKFFFWALPRKFIFWGGPAKISYPGPRKTFRRRRGNPPWVSIQQYCHRARFFVCRDSSPSSYRRKDSVQGQSTVSNHNRSESATIGKQNHRHQTTTLTRFGDSLSHRNPYPVSVIRMNKRVFFFFLSRWIKYYLALPRDAHLSRGKSRPNYPLNGSILYAILFFNDFFGGQ